MNKNLYTIKFHHKVEKFLKFHVELRKRFLEKMELLTNGEFEKLDIIPLKGKNNHYRLRIGGYRFFCEIVDEILVIYFYDADTRGDAYK
ncbi:hypothetical protein AGMMS50249_4950 [candidate division SR1 bacterium]|nr:hypothetical protein AGMMS50249_4950 [candidate division SR1 bacterium]